MSGKGTIMKKWWLWVGVAAVFFCGVALGAAGGSLYQRLQYAQRFKKIRASHGAYFADLALKRLERKLALTPEQQKRIKPLVHKAFGRMHELRLQFKPRLDQEMQLTMEKIKPLLTPEQRQKLKQEGGWNLLRNYHRSRKSRSRQK